MADIDPAELDAALADTQDYLEQLMACATQRDKAEAEVAALREQLSQIMLDLIQAFPKATFDPVRVVEGVQLAIAGNLLASEKAWQLQAEVAALREQLATYRASAGEQDIRLAGLEAERDAARASLSRAMTEAMALKADRDRRLLEEREYWFGEGWRTARRTKPGEYQETEYELCHDAYKALEGRDAD